jgi:hypothetical protein
MSIHDSGWSPGQPVPFLQTSGLASSMQERCYLDARNDPASAIGTVWSNVRIGLVRPVP